MKKYFSRWLEICIESDLYAYYIFMGGFAIYALFSGQNEGLLIALSLFSFTFLMHSFTALSK